MKELNTARKKNPFSILGLTGAALLIAGFFTNYIAIADEVGISGFTVVKEIFLSKDSDSMLKLAVFIPTTLLIISVIIIVMASLGQHMSSKLILAAKILPLIILTIVTVYFTSAFVETGPALAIFQLFGLGFYLALGGALVVLAQPVVQTSADRKILIIVILVTLIIMGLPWLKYSSAEFGIQGNTNGFTDWGSLSLIGVLWLLVFVFIGPLSSSFNPGTKRLLSFGFLLMLAGAILFSIKNSKPPAEMNEMPMKISIGYGIYVMSLLSLAGITWSFLGKRKNYDEPSKDSTVI